MEFLPDTLLELIFEMTGDVYSLRDLLFVCNRFREVILGSSLLMKKLPIEFRESDDIFLNKHHAIVQNILKLAPSSYSRKQIHKNIILFIGNRAKFKKS